jgi:hypothetical protein
MSHQQYVETVELERAFLDEKYERERMNALEQDEEFARSLAELHPSLLLWPGRKEST